jgi:hypothetical protein
MLALLEFIEAPRFTQLLHHYFSDDDYGDLQIHLAKNPEAGEVIQGTGAFAKCGGRTRGGVRAGEAA